MKTVCVIIGFLAFSLTASAQKDTLIGPHQGRLFKSGAYRLEVLGCNDYLEIYLYDSDREAILNYGIHGNVEFYYKGETYLNAPVVCYGEDGFTAKIASPDFLYAKVSLVVYGNFVYVKFENECSITGRAGK
jgi:hypothetical protein